MRSEDRSALWAIASAIAYPIVGDRARVAVLAARSVAWLEDRNEIGAPVAWLTSHIVDAATSDAPVPGRTLDAERSSLAGALRAEPTATRVAFALRYLCGYDLETTARLCQRSVEEVEQLLAPVANLATTVGPLAQPRWGGDAAMDTPTSGDGGRAAKPARYVAPSAPSAPSAAGTSTTDAHGDGDDERRGRRRWFRPGAGTLAALFLITVSVVGITYPGGARPTLSKPLTGTPCNGGRGPGTVSSVKVGPTNRTARLFVPATSSVNQPIMLLIGDGASTAENTVATTGLESAAATEGFVLVTLDGSAGPWNVGQTPGGSDDVGYATAAIARAAKTGCVDKTALSVVGFGTGAHLAADLACTSSLHVTQLVMIHGTYLPPKCTPAGRVSVLMDVDQTDNVLPITGGWGPTATAAPGYTPASLDAAWDGWSQLEGCGPTSSGEAEASGLVISTRQGCPSGTQLIARVSNGQGPAWPAEALGATVRFVSGQ